MYIDLLPETEKKQLRQLRNANSAFVAAVLITALICVSVLMLLIPMIQLHVGVVAPERERNNHNQALSYATLQEQVKEINRTIEVLHAEDGAAHALLPSVALRRLIDAVVRARKTSGTSLTIEGIEFTGSAPDISESSNTHIVIRGVAATRYSLLAYKNALETTEGVGTVDAPISNFISSKKIAYTITITMK